MLTPNDKLVKRGARGGPRPPGRRGRVVRGQPSVDEVVGVRIPGLPLHDIGLGRLVRQGYSRHLW